MALIFYILRNQDKRNIVQEKREIKYQIIIFNLSEKLNLVEENKKDVLE
ncbi:BhlA/UviB family holin-like peptide [Lutispora thermophila]